MKLDYDSLPTLMLVAAGLFVMFASPPTVNYDEVESAGKRLGNENNELYGNTYVLGSDESVEIVMDAVIEAIKIILKRDSASRIFIFNK